MQKRRKYDVCVYIYMQGNIIKLQKKKKILPCDNMDEPAGFIMLGEIRQIKKGKYCMISIISGIL